MSLGRLTQQAPANWVTKVIGDVFTVVERPVKMDDETLYRRVTVKRRNGGIELRDIKRGAEIKVKNQFEIKAGDFLISERQIVHGACGIVPPELAGALVSNEYLVLEPREGIDASFFNYLFQLLKYAKLFLICSQGVDIEKFLFKPRDWLKKAVPAPPLPEQQKIAAILTVVDDKLDVIARQIEIALSLKRGLMQTLFSRGVGAQDADNRWVPHSEFKDSDGRRLPRAWEGGTLRAYVASLRSGVSVNAEDRPHGEGEIGVLKVSCVQGGSFLPSNHKTVVPDELTRAAESVQQGRIIISRANTPALVGESAYIHESWPDLFLPDKLWQTEPTDTPHSVRWLSFYLQSPFVRQEIRTAATGTSGSMKNISKAALLGIFMPVVPLAEQLRIAELLTAITLKIDALESKRELYQSVKRGLMQKLLTGEWRVKLGVDMAD
ncbi:restriction endonuclease subunit S [Roseateles sp.]|uniref:restriction endonuclease subunit S n=1 Tax=Roseateles sp. TaxID=1971397 RepID=UPI00286A6888|nr:restriction endonuclease subunit S [Roseateles sp.]